MKRVVRFGIHSLLIVLPLIVLAFGASRYVRGVFRYLNTDARLAGTMSAEASRLLGREVRIGDVKITGNLWSLTAKNSIELRNIAVAAETTLDKGIFARADSVRVDYNLQQILFASNVQVPLVNNVRLLRPLASLIRDKKGEWNVSKLLTGKGVPGRPFTDKITVTDATVLYDDALFPAPSGVPQRRLVTRIDKVSGIVQLRDPQNVAFDLTAAGLPGYGANILATGTLRLNPLLLSTRLKADALNLPALAARFVSTKQAQIARGTANADLTILYTPKAKKPGKASPNFRDVFDASGSITAQNLDVFAPEIGTPFRNTTLDATFNRNLLRAKISTLTAGANIALDGVAALQWTPKLTVAHFAAETTVQNANLKRLRTDLQIAKRFQKQLAALAPNIRREILRAEGQGDIRFHVAGTPPNLTADAALNMASLTAAGYGVKNIALTADYADNKVNADLRAQFGKGTLALRGHADTTGKQAFRIAGRGRDLDLAALQIAGRQKLAGTGKLDIAASGERGQTPKIQAQAAFDNLRYRGQTLRSLYAIADTVGSQLTLRTVRIDDPKGFALASGTVDLKTRQLNINVGANELDLDRLKDALQAANPRALAAVKTLVPNNPTGNREQNDSLSNDPTTQQPNNPTVQRPASPDDIPLKGAGYLRGKITGELTHPHLRTQLNLFNVQSGEYSLDRVSATLDVTKDALIIAQGTANRYPGTIRFSGLVADPFQPDPEISLNATLDNLDLTDLARLAGLNPDAILINGSLSTEEDVQIEGKTGALRVRRPIVLRFDEASVNGLALRDARIEATYDGKTVTVASANINVAGGRVTASGSVTKEGALNLRVEGETLGLEDLTFALPLTIADIKKVQGTLDFQANVGGTIKDPKADVTLTGSGLIYNTYALGTLEAKATYEDKTARVPSLTLISPVGSDGKRGELTITDALYNTDTKAIDGAIRWKEFSIERIREFYANTRFAETKTGQRGLDIFNQFTDPVEGTLSGSLVVGGTVDTPEATLNWDAREVKAGRYAFTSFSGSAKANKEKLVIPAPSLPERILRLEFPEGIIEGENVSVTYGGTITGDVRANNVDLAIIKTWLPDNAIVRELTGKGDLFIQASGTTNKPQLELSYLNLQNIAFRNFSVDRVEILNALVTEGKIQADTIRVSKTDRERNIKYQANASGSIAFSFSPPFIADDAALDFKADLLNEDIRALVAPNPRIPNASNGTFSLTALVSGTKSAPNLFGFVTIDAPQLQFGGISTGLRDVKGQINLVQDQIVVANNFQARSQIYRKDGLPSQEKGKTGEPITLTGSLPLGIGNEGETGEIRLETPKFVFEESGIEAAPNGAARGEANVKLRITGSAVAPTLGGDIIVTNAQFSLPSEFVGLSGAGVALPIAPTLDLTVRLAEKVRLTNAQLNALTDGEVRLFGTIPDYQLRGRVFLREGRLTLPTARFTIIPTGEVTATYPTYIAGAEGQLEPTLGLNVNLKAQTNLSARSISNVQRRYKVTVTAIGALTGGAVDPVTGRSRLNLNFQSDPPDLAGNQEQMFRKLAGVLGGAENIELFSRNPGQAFAAQLTNIFTSSVLPGLFDNFAQSSGFEEFVVNYDPIQRLNLLVSRRLFGPFYASYNRTLSGAQEQYILRLSARFQERYQVSYEVNERNVQRYLLEGVWRF